MRVCFLFNHYATHQVAHAAPFAFELSRRHENAEVTVACTSDAQCEAAARIATLYAGHRVEFVRLEIPWFERYVASAVGRLTFFGKRRILSRNREFFRAFDAVVSPERTVLQLRTRFGLDRLIIINTRHGQGDRLGSFDELALEVDLTLFAGRKYVDLFEERGLLRKGAYAIVGYPKFEVYGPSSRQAWFPNRKPVVLYNPHFDATESSWQKQGRAALDWFAAQTEYNLILAPHTLLFERSVRHGARLPRRFREIEHIRIDLGSEASNDMTYTRGADIYLGDASSQVYEFIAEPRPCVFIDAQNARSRSPARYRHWHFGPVITRASELGPALRAARDGFAGYAVEQREAFEYTFSFDRERSAAQRGADAIAEFLQRGRIESECFLR